MWMKLVCGLLVLASVNANDAVNVAPEINSEALHRDAMPSFDRKLPTAQELLEMLDSMTGMSDQEKANLKEELLKTIQPGDIPQQVAGYDFTMQTMVLLSLLGLVGLIFVFFVYKLFKCLSEREMKREEKKKNKQLRKKK